MKYSVIFTTVIALVVSGQLVFAGEITDTYTAGDTLTAAKMNNIKTAVNDNNNASRFYGDGSAGALTISSNSSWTDTPPTGINLNFTDVVIDVGFTLTVPAGTTIRCTGSFTNNGTITVETQNNSGNYFLSVNTYLFAQNRITKAGIGDAVMAPSFPQGHSTLGVTLAGAQGGKGISQTVAASSFNNFKYGGGGGGGAQSNTGGGGGGLIKINCQGGITNNGTIRAIGGTGGGGGGGGGIVILASSTSILNSSTGSIDVTGGAGENADVNNGASGGGGGGIIVLVAPSILNTLGSTSFIGGLAGTGGTTLTSTLHSAGAAGGASGGNGGYGGNIDVNNLSSISANGDDGYILEITANPAYMM